MNPKENVVTAHRRGIPERVPAVIYGGGVWTMKYNNHRFEDFVGKPREYADMIIHTAAVVRSDMVFPGSGYNNLHATALGGRIKYRPIGAPDLEEPLIRGPEDLKRMDVERLQADEAINTIWEATRLVQEAIGQQYLVATTAWGPFTLAAQFYGVEEMMRGTFKQKDLVHAVLELATEVNYRFYRPMIEAGYLEAVALADPSASGDLISRKQFKDFAIPYLKKLADRLHALGALVFLHICGDTTDRLDLFPETGADLIAIDHKVDMAKVKETIGDKMCIAGNVNPVTALNEGTPDDVRRAAEDCIARAAAGGSYVLLPGCDIPPTVPLENIRALIDTAHGHRY